MVLCISLLGCLERFCPHITTKSKNNGVRSPGVMCIESFLAPVGNSCMSVFPKGKLYLIVALSSRK